MIEPRNFDIRKADTLIPAESNTGDIVMVRCCLLLRESAWRQCVSHKLQLCPERYLPIIEAAIDGAIKMEE